MLSLSVQLITLKCYPGFLGLFPVKEKKEKTYVEPFSSTDNTQMLSWFPRFDHSERRREKENLHWAFQFDDTQMLSWFPRFVPCERKKRRKNPTMSLSVQLITLKCYPGFLGLFTVKEEEEKKENLCWAFQFDC